MNRLTMKEYGEELTTTLSICFLPYFIGINTSKDYIHIVLSSGSFKTLTLNQRLDKVYTALKKMDGKILEEVPVIVECLTPAQVETFIEQYF